MILTSRLPPLRRGEPTRRKDARAAAGLPRRARQSSRRTRKKSSKKMFRGPRTGNLSVWSCPPSGGDRYPRRSPPIFIAARPRPRQRSRRARCRAQRWSRSAARASPRRLAAIGDHRSASRSPGPRRWPASWRSRARRCRCPAGPTRSARLRGSTVIGDVQMVAGARPQRPPRRARRRPVRCRRCGRS